MVELGPPTTPGAGGHWASIFNEAETESGWLVKEPGFCTNLGLSFGSLEAEFGNRAIVIARSLRASIASSKASSLYLRPA